MKANIEELLSQAMNNPKRRVATEAEFLAISYEWSQGLPVWCIKRKLGLPLPLVQGVCDFLKTGMISFMAGN